MSDPLSTLLLSGTPTLESSGKCEYLPNLFGALGRELADVVDKFGGRYCFDQALLFRSWTSIGPPLGASEWNNPGLWKDAYPAAVQKAHCFAEDVFGTQYCISSGRVCVIEPETGEISNFASTISDWARRILDEPNLFTGGSLLKSWEQEFGKLGEGMRLVPKVPFVCGGEYTPGNLFRCPEVEGMRLRGQIAAQIAGLPDGARVILRELTPPGT